MANSNDATTIQAVAQDAINKRLDDLRFKVMTGDEFDADEGQHSIYQVSFVVRVNDNDEPYVELYKGNSKIGSTGNTHAVSQNIRSSKSNLRGGEDVDVNHCVVYGNYNDDDIPEE